MLRSNVQLDFRCVGVTNSRHTWQIYQSTKSQTESKNLVFIGNLPFTITENDLLSLSESKVGKNLVRSVLVPVGKKSKKGLGYAFLDYKNREAANKAVEAFDGLMYNERPLNSNFKDESEISSKKKTRIEKNTIFLSNLDLSLTEEELINMCNDILGEGLVVSIEIPVDKFTRNPRGFAFIEFVNVETVNKAIAELNNLEVLERLLSCAEMKRPSIAQVR
eukprot:CAMPEP_0170073046 /NCGR_PEP_ID=MMETSP0019_2-20121128/10534_1 /TAXON_ID=98059 /ORGANISM="Dinobryon sp., Strain UTEXLB2267" /LENGTH=219 /DNA_ID=CAMNT_0010282325 /DNA_START=91 /DNA_END=750 /DNA_ORIENTATION=+